MEIALYISLVLVVISIIYLLVISLLCIHLDPELDKVQKWGQSIFAILIPILGPCFVLHTVNDHSPKVIEKMYIPWPFKSIVIPSTKIHKSGPGSNGEEISGAHSGGGSSDGGGGGGGD